MYGLSLCNIHLPQYWIFFFHFHISQSRFFVWALNVFGLGGNGGHFADAIFKLTLISYNVCISIRISLQFVFNGHSVKVIRCQSLSKPMMAQFTDAYVYYLASTDYCLLLKKINKPVILWYWSSHLHSLYMANRYSASANSLHCCCM